MLDVGFPIYGTNGLTLHISTNKNGSNALTWETGDMFFTFLFLPGDIFDIIHSLILMQTVLTAPGAFHPGQTKPTDRWA